MDKVEIKREGGKWLINGKKYTDLTWPEKVFFDEFLYAMRGESEQVILKRCEI